MKKSIFLAVILFVLAFTMNAQNDTMYVMKNGLVINKQSVKPDDVDSVIFYQPTITPGNTFTDSRDGHVYNIVTIGTQVWMAENLKYLPSVAEPDTGSQTTPYYYVFGYNGTNVTSAKASSNYSTYGVLYNWPAAMNQSASSSTNPSGVQGVCPIGWHLPSDAEWSQLTTYLGGESVAGGKLKEIGTTHWTSPNTGATNETGFKALPGGYRHVDGAFYDVGSSGTWWSTTKDFEASVESAWCRYVYYNDGNVYRDYSYNVELGYYVRCLRD